MKRKINYIALYLLGIYISCNAQQQFSFTRIYTGDIVTDNNKSYCTSLADYDNDGDFDVFVGNWGENNSLYSNNGDGTFTKVTVGPVVTDIGNSVSCSWGDYDNDGYLDLFVANSDYDNSRIFLYHNNGDNTFTKITTGAIVTDEVEGHGCSWGDFNSDGYLDLFVLASCKDYLYFNNGNGTFNKVIYEGYCNTYGSSIADYDNDNDLDIFVAGRENNYIYENNGDGTFSINTSGPIGTDIGTSESGSWGDYDNDGDLDLFVANDGTVNFLYKNNGNGTFTKIYGSIVTDLARSMGSNWADYDNDGDLDLLVVNLDWYENLYLYSNNGDGTFTQIDISSFGTGYSADCVSGDVNNDGNTDIFIVNTTSHNLLFLNNEKSNNWLKVKCKGTISNRSAIGTKVKICTNVNNEIIWQYREITGKSGDGNQNAPYVHFGLGNCSNIDTLIIKWPSGIVQRFTNIAANKLFEVTEIYNLVQCDFIASPRSGSAPLSVSFNDNSTGEISEWLWSFGDGGKSSQQNPSHTYQTEGVYTVSLTVIGPGGSDTETKKDYILVIETPSAGFIAEPLSGTLPLEVRFSDQSNGFISHWYWDFGDDSTSFQQNPSHTYQTAGVYTVSLTVCRPWACDTETKMDYITVYEKLNADFIANPLSGSVPLAVGFTDKSSGNVTNWSWNFGDGKTSNQQNPTHIYQNEGEYTVSLTISANSSNDNETKENFIKVTELLQSLTVSIPDTQAASEETIWIPIRVNDLSGLDIISYQGKLTFNPEIIIAKGASSLGTISSVFNDPFVNLQNSGVLLFGGFGVYPLEGAGDLVNLVFDVVGNIGDSTELNFSSFEFNSGEPTCATSSSIFYVRSSTNIKSAQILNNSTDYYLSQGFPNPFNNTIKFEYAVPIRRHVSIAVYDVIGSVVVNLYSGVNNIGTYSISWNGIDNLGNQVPSGLYFVKLQAANVNKTSKLILLR